MELSHGFQSNSTSHNHQPATGVATAAEIMVAVKAEALKNLFKLAPAFANKVIWIKYFDSSWIFVAQLCYKLVNVWIIDLNF